MEANLEKHLLAEDTLCIVWCICGTRMMFPYRNGSIYACTYGLKEGIYVLHKDILVYVQEPVCPVINISAILPFWLKPPWRGRQPVASVSDYWRCWHTEELLLKLQALTKWVTTICCSSRKMFTALHNTVSPGYHPARHLCPVLRTGMMHWISPRGPRASHRISHPCRDPAQSSLQSLGCSGEKIWFPSAEGMGKMSLLE